MAEVIQEKGSIGKDDAIDILDRVIGFVGNCDNKASIMLGIFTALVALVVTTDGISGIIEIITDIHHGLSIYGILFLILWGFSFISLLVGSYFFILALKGNTESGTIAEDSRQLDSIVFFGDIAKNKSCDEYRKKLLAQNESDLIDDLIMAIYMNSRICSTKFKNYNLGLKISVIAYSAFFMLWLVGYILF